MSTYYYDYEQVPIEVADEAFQDYYHNSKSVSILDLLADLVRHCDQWCDEHQAFSENDNRERILRKMQSYLHEKYSSEITELLEAAIIKNREKIRIMATIHQRRN